MLTRWDHYLQELVHVVQVPLVTQIRRFSTIPCIGIYGRNSKSLVNFAQVGREPSRGRPALRDHSLISTHHETRVDVQSSEGFLSL